MAVLVAQIIGLAVQVRRPNPNGGDAPAVRLIRYWAIGLMSPPEKALHGSGSGLRGLRLCTQPAMRAAQHLYETTGFTRTPDLDWSPAPGLILRAYELALPVSPPGLPEKISGR